MRWLLASLVLLALPGAAAQPPELAQGVVYVSPDEIAIRPTESASLDVRFEWSCSQFDMESGTTARYKVQFDVFSNNIPASFKFDQEHFEGVPTTTEPCTDDRPRYEVSTILRINELSYDAPGRHVWNFTVYGRITQWQERPEPVPGFRFGGQFEQNASVSYLPVIQVWPNESSHRWDGDKLSIHDDRYRDHLVGFRHHANVPVEVVATVRDPNGSQIVELIDWMPRTVPPDWMGPAAPQIKVILGGPLAPMDFDARSPAVLRFEFREAEVDGGVNDTFEEEITLWYRGAASTPDLTVPGFLVALLVGTVLWKRSRT